MSCFNKNFWITVVGLLLTLVIALLLLVTFKVFDGYDFAPEFQIAGDRR